jgi:hypothetical protein
MISKGTHLTFILEHQAEFHITLHSLRIISPLDKAEFHITLHSLRIISPLNKAELASAG